MNGSPLSSSDVWPACIAATGSTPDPRGSKSTAGNVAPGRRPSPEPAPPFDVPASPELRGALAPLPPGVVAVRVPSPGSARAAGSSSLATAIGTSITGGASWTPPSVSVIVWPPLAGPVPDVPPAAGVASPSLRTFTGTRMTGETI